MALEDAKRVLLDLHPETDINTVLSALHALANRTKSNSMNVETYGIIVRALVDKVAPILASWPREDSERGCRLFDSVLLNGNASLAFREMSSAIVTGSENSEIVARTLLMFVDKRLGGVERLRAVLSAADARDHVSALVHLPTRVFNVLYAESEDAFGAPEVLQQEEYFGALAEAVYLQPKTPDPQRDQALSELLGRMIRMKQADTMVSSWLSQGDTENMIWVILRTPQNSVASLVRALLNIKADSVALSRRVGVILSAVLRESRIACDACINRLPFERPLFKRPRTALKRLARAIDSGGGKSALNRALHIAAERWSAEDFSLYADIQLQRQVTRLLLYYLRLTADIAESKQMFGEDSVMLVLVEGVHLRLGQNDVRIRRHGMIIGEASSRHCEERDPLTFDRDRMTEVRKDDAQKVGDERFDDGGDSDFTELAYKIGEKLSDEEISGSQESGEEQVEARIAERKDAHARQTRQGNDIENEAEDNADGTQAKGRRRRHMTAEVEEDEWWRDTTGVEHPWVQEDDWSSIDSYETSSCDDEGDARSGTVKAQERDYEAVREKIGAPMSVARLLGLLREVNKSSGGGVSVDAETTAAALRTIARRAEKSFTERGTTLHAVAEDLLMEVVGVDAERFPDDMVGEIAEGRLQAMQKLVEMDVGGCGVGLVERVICGPHSDVGKRSECLAVLSGSLRGAEERAREIGRRRREEDEEKAAEAARIQEARRIGRVTRRVGRRRGLDGGSGGVREFRGWDEEGLGRVFEMLAGRLVGGGGADFVDVGGRDCQLWAQGIVTLGVIAGLAGVCDAGRRMRGEVVEIVMGHVLRGEAAGDAVVRRGCALALGAVVEGMTEAEIRGGVVVGVGEEGSDEVAQAADWLRQAAHGDADVGVRRFARRALAIWAARVERAA